MRQNNPTCRRIRLAATFSAVVFVVVIVVVVVDVIVVVVVVVGRVRRAIPIRRAFRRRLRRCRCRQRHGRSKRLQRCPGHPVPGLPVSWPI